MARKLSLEELVAETVQNYTSNQGCTWAETAEIVLDSVDREFGLMSEAVHKLLIRGLAQYAESHLSSQAATQRRTMLKARDLDIKSPEQCAEDWERYTKAHDLLVEHNICSKAKCLCKRAHLQDCVAYYFRGCDVTDMTDEMLARHVTSIVDRMRNQQQRTERQAEQLGRDQNFRTRKMALKMLESIIGPELWDVGNGQHKNPLHLTEEDEEYILRSRQAIINGHENVIAWITETRAIMDREGKTSRLELSHEGTKQVSYLSKKYLASPTRGRATVPPDRGLEGYME